MVVEQRRVPALELGCHEVLAGVMVDGDDGQFVHQDGFGLLEEFEPRGGVSGAGGLADEAVVFLVAPAGLVLATVGQPHVEEGVRVHVIARPAGAANLVVQLPLRIQIHLPLLVQQLGVDAQVFLPHLLDGLGDDAVGFLRVVEQFEGREPLAVGEAGVGQQLLRLGQVAAELAARGVAGRAGWSDVEGGDLPGLEDVLGDGRAVNGEGEGFAHALVVERRLRDVHAVEIGREIGLDADEVGVVLPVAGDF